MQRSTVQNGSITRNNLVLNLDASNLASYPGTGNIWFDISGYGNHFNLQGITKPTFNVNKIDFNYNGGNQYASCQNTTFGNMGTGSYTFEYVYYYVQTPTATLASIIKKRSGAATIASGQLGLGNPPVLPAPNWTFIDGYWRYTGSINNGSPGFTHNVGGGWTSIIDEAGLRNVTAGYLSVSPPALTKAHVVHVFKRGFPDFREVTASVYINNTSLPNSTTNYHLSGSGIVSNNLAATLMIAENYRTGSLYYIRAYNRELTRTEIAQNYILAQSKYGL
jgi:hypothetical protein